MAWFGNQEILDQGMIEWKGFVGASKYTLTEAGTIESLSLYLYVADGNVRYAIYSDDAGAPGALQCETPGREASSGWFEIDTETNPTLPAGTYWLAWQVFRDTVNISALDGDANQHAFIAHAWGDFPDPFGTPSYDIHAYSIYATYTAAPPVVGGYAAIF